MLLSSTYCLNGTVANFIIDVLMFSLLTELFISSGIFLVFIIAESFFGKPNRGQTLALAICGVKSRQYFKKVVYAAAWSPASALDIAYCPQTI